MPLKSHCAIVLFSLAVASGCGPKSGPEPTVERVVAVSGTLTFKGTPLESYQISFLPTDGRRPAVGVTDAAGKFVLGTNRQGDGAPPGSHKVSVAWFAPPVLDEAGQEIVIDDPALLPKPNIQIPDKYASPDTSGLTQEVPEDGLNDLKIDLQ